MHELTPLTFTGQVKQASPPLPNVLLNLHSTAGAQAAGCDSLFVAGGIHAEETGVHPRLQEVYREGMEKLFSEYSVKPTFVIPYLQC